MWPPPLEVETNDDGEQLFRVQDGKHFQRYVECAGGCGWWIGVGDAADTATHASCAARLAAATTSDAIRTTSATIYMPAVDVHAAMDDANNPPRDGQGRWTPLGEVKSFSFKVDDDTWAGPFPEGTWLDLDGGQLDLTIYRDSVPPTDWRGVLRTVTRPWRWYRLPSVIHAWRNPPPANDFSVFADAFKDLQPAPPEMKITTTVRRLGPDSVWADDFDPYHDCDPPCMLRTEWMFPHVLGTAWDLGQPT